MSRRARSAPKVTVSASVRTGLASLVEGNEATIRDMLSLGADAPVVDGLIACMGVNALSAEMLLATYFSQTLLGAYCAARLGKSDKGGAATLAARIAREWAKPAFAPLPLPSAPVVALAPLQAPRPASEQERLHGVYSASAYPFGDDEDDTRHENLKRKAPAGGSEDAPAPAKRRVSDVHDAALKKRACEVVNLAFEQNRKQLARETKGCEETPEEWLFDVMEGDAMECLGMRARVCEVEPMAAYVQPHSCIYEHTLVFRAARGKLELVRWSV